MNRKKMKWNLVATKTKVKTNKEVDFVENIVQDKLSKSQNNDLIKNKLVEKHNLRIPFLLNPKTYTKNLQSSKINPFANLGDPEANFINKIKESYLKVFLSSKLQIKLLTRNLSKSITAVFCILISVFFTLVIALVPAVISDYRLSQERFVPPYSDYVNTTSYDTSSASIQGFDPYWQGSPSPSLNFSQVFESLKSSGGFPDYSYFSGLTTDNTNWLSTFNFDDPTSNAADFNLVPFVTQTYQQEVDNEQVQRGFTYLPTSLNNYTAADSHVVGDMTAIFATFLVSLGIRGLNGVYLDTQTIDALAFFDGYSYYYYINGLNKTAWLANRLLTITLAEVLLQTQSHNVILQNALQKIVSPDSNDDTVGFSSLFIAIITSFAPSSLANAFEQNHSSILEMFANAKPNTNENTLILPRSFGYYNILDSTVNNTYLSFGAVPYDPGVDEAFTDIVGNVTINNGTELSNIDVFGLNGNLSDNNGSNDYPGSDATGKISRIWQSSAQNRRAYESLVRNDAYVRSVDSLPLGYKNSNDEYKSAQKAIPVVINQTFAKLHNVGVGRTLTFSVKRANKSAGITYNSENAFKVVGETDTFGKAIIFTSRQEANSLIYTEKASSSADQLLTTNTSALKAMFEVPLYDSASETPSSDQIDVRKKAANLESVSNQQYNAPGFGDGLGYFNSVFFGNADQDILQQGIIFTLNGGGTLNDLNPTFGERGFFDGVLLASSINSLSNFYYLIFYLISFTLLFFSAILFILSQRLIIAKNRKPIAALKVMGYSLRRILFVTTSGYFLLSLIAFVVVISLSNIIGNVILNIFLNLLNLNNYVPPVVTPDYTYGIFAGIFVLFNLLLLFLTIREIKKSKAKEVLDNG